MVPVKSLEPVLIPIKKLKPWQGNPRTIDKASFNALVNSLRDFGQRENLIINSDMTVISGHMRLRALKKLGYKDAMCDVVELSKDDEKKLNLIMNSPKLQGQFDTLKVDELLAELSVSEDDLGLYRLPELGTLDLSDDGLTHDEPPAVDTSKPAVSQFGEVYELGRHRLICGNSTSESNLQALFGGEQPVMLVTSPPYADVRDYNIGEFDWDKLMNGVADTLKGVPDCNLLINLGQVHRDGKVWFYWNKWLEYMERLGMPVFGLYVWDKLNPIPGAYHGRLALSHEWIFHFRTNDTGVAKKTVRSKHAKGSGANTFRQKDGTLKKASGGAHTRNQDFKLQDSVIRVPPEKHNTTAHPVVYSVAFAAELIKPWSEPGGIIYDCFAGSGTTAIAAEQLDRTCYMSEIDPKYCDVIRKRYHKFVSGTEDGWQKATPKLK